ncbi:MAG TPA: hypothetical protein VF656_17155 [Pyrinomonadaceae bacterium]|jgi:hypothetical protein
MNCQQFTSIIVEAARAPVMDAAAREEALRHAETCEACGARLREEQRLTGALRTVAASMKDLGAPARLEAQLLSAFRQNLAAAQSPTHDDAAHAPDAQVEAGAHATATRARLVRPTPLALPVETKAAHVSSQQRIRLARVLTTAIAASLALVALVALYKQFTRTTPDTVTIAASNGAHTTANHETNNAPNVETNSASNVETAAGNASERETMPTRVSQADRTLAQSQSVAISPATASPAHTSTGRVERERRQAAQLVAAAGGRAPARFVRPAAPRMIASRQVIDGGSAVFAEGDDVRANNQASGASKPGEAESVTEFIPLVAGAPEAQPLESGQVVRVKLPRAALASLGLPLNAERSNETVKADVLLGNDGLARAIRFVR